jgi:hypothetical protein
MIEAMTNLKMAEFRPKNQTSGFVNRSSEQEY